VELAEGSEGGPCYTAIALRDIEKGEEILCVYGYNGSWDLTIATVKGKRKKNPVSKQQGPKRQSQ
jgi:hypothetical protein